MLKKIMLHTKQRDQLIDITEYVQNFVKELGINDGAVLIFCPHTTGGITINENADPDVKKDFIRRLDEVFPWEHPEDQHLEGNTAAHLKASMVGSSQHVIVHNGKLLLGTWQGIYFCEFDGPRTRTFYIKKV